MNSEYEKQLEANVSRELKRLPELQAPVTLARRVMAAIEQRATVPWYRRAWQSWPASLRVLSLLVLLSLFGGVCFGAWQLERMHGFDLLIQEIAGLLSPIISLCNALIAVLAAFVSVVKQLGTLFLIGCLVAMALAWAMCLGLGTVCVRLAFARR